jgi:hypothetical protein
MLQRDRKITESLSSTTAALIHFCRLSRDHVTAGFRADTAALLNAGGDIHLPVVLTNTFQVYPSPKMANH